MFLCAYRGWAECNATQDAQVIGDTRPASEEGWGMNDAGETSGEKHQAA